MGTLSHDAKGCLPAGQSSRNGVHFAGFERGLHVFLTVYPEPVSWGSQSQLDTSGVQSRWVTEPHHHHHHHRGYAHPGPRKPVFPNLPRAAKQAPFRAKLGSCHGSQQRGRPLEWQEADSADVPQASSVGWGVDRVRVLPSYLSLRQHVSHWL